jgi:pimeloyl-ACP methyl ester carboxylesterase
VKTLLQNYHVRIQRALDHFRRQLTVTKLMQIISMQPQSLHKTRRMPATRSLLAALLLFNFSAAPASAEDVVGPTSRAEAVKIIAGLRKIVSPEGLQSVEAVHIGGIQQIVSIRSQDLRNPVLLILHGGPGYVQMPLDWWWDRGLDEYFTVIQWDQRDAGKTYTASGPTDPALLTPETYQKDTEELVQWALKRFGKRKLFVLGHSWGSLLGLRLAAEHPEWLHAYIGMGQGVDCPESERRGWAWTMQRAKEEHNAEAIRELQSIAPYATGARPLTVDDVMIERKWLDQFGGAAWRRTGAEIDRGAYKLAPEYTDDDVRNAFKGQPAVTKALFPAIVATDLSGIRKLKTPLILLLGRHDKNVSSEVAAEWFATVSAPSKQLIWFERSGHHIYSEEPGKLLYSLITYARPIAARAGDVAP